MLRYLLAAALAVTCFHSVPPSSAADAPTDAIAVSGKRKINLAGRQRMLTQYMAKATCFVFLGVDDKEQMNQVFAMHDLFAKTLVDLRQGNPDLAMLPENNPDILAGLDEVQKRWEVYSRAVMQDRIDDIMTQNLVVLEAMNRTVAIVEKTYGGATGKVPAEIAAAINISGRQRMLSQRASKEHCLVAAGFDPEVNRKNLADTIALFEKSLAALRDGDAALGLGKAPNPEILAQIKTGGEEWAALKPVLDRAAKGEPPTIDDVEAVAQQNTHVLDAMDDLVKLYEAAGK